MATVVRAWPLVAKVQSTAFLHRLSVLGFRLAVDALSGGLPESLQRKIFYQKAQGLYPRMPALRTRGPGY